MTSQTLTRDLKLVDVYAISTGAMFSSGLFLLPGIAFGQSGSWIILAYLLSALMTVPAMLSKAELCAAMPRAGGTYYFLDRSMGPLVGTVGGLGTWIAMGLKSAFALIGIGAYLGIFLDLDITMVAIVLTIVFTGLNIFGASETARLQRWLVYALISILVLFILAGFVDISSEGLIQRTQERLGSAATGDVEGLLATVGLVFISYAGLTKVCGVAEEIQNPNRNILRGMALSLATAAIIYTAVAYILVMVIDHQALPTDLAPVATAAERVFDWMPGRIGVIVACTAALAAFASTANVGIMSASRYLFAMGRDNLVPQSFRGLGRFGTPTLAVLITGGFVGAVLLTLDVVAVAKLASAFQLLMFAFVNAAVIVMRESKIESYDPAVKSPLYPWMQLMGIFFSLALIVELGHLPMLFTLGLIAVGVAWYFAYAKTRVVRRGAILHWFERLGRDRFEELEEELRHILMDPGLHEEDPFDELIERAQIMDFDSPMDFVDVARMAGERLAEHVPLKPDVIADEFVVVSRLGMIPVELGAALPHFQVAELQDCQLVVARAPEGIAIHLGDEHPSGERDVSVQALFFLISPEEHPARHLRMLAKLASLIERPGFLSTLLKTEGPDEWRRLLAGDAVRDLAKQMTSKLQTPASQRARDTAGEFENILVVCRGHQDADLIERAGHLADIRGGRVKVVGLVRPPYAPQRSIAEALEAECAEHLEASVAPLRERGIEVTTEVLVGNPWVEVIRAVERDGRDLVIVGPGGTPGKIGSFGQHLLRKCPCPVWVMREERPKRWTKILATVAARSGDDDGHDAMDARVLQLAQRLATQEGAELHVLHAWKMPDPDLLQRRGVSREEVAQTRRDRQASLQSALSAALERQGLDPQIAQVHLVEGEAAASIQQFTADNGVDLVILGTTGSVSVTGQFIGDTAEDAVHGLDCAILALKPEGFVSPVRPR